MFRAAVFFFSVAIRAFKPMACNFIKKESLAQVFSYEFCEISKNTFRYRTPPVAASRSLPEFSLAYFDVLALQGDHCVL